MKTSLNLETVAFFSVLPDAVFILNEAESIEYANPAALQYCQTTLPKMIASSLDDWINIVAVGKPGRRPADRWDNGMATLERQGEIKCGDQTIPVLFTSATVAQKTIVRARRISNSEGVVAAEKQRQVTALSQNQNRGQSRFAMSLVHELSQPLCSAILEAGFAAKNAEQLAAKYDESKELHTSLLELQALHKGMERTLDKVRNIASKSLDEVWEVCHPATTVKKVIEQVKFRFEAENLSVTLEDKKNLPKIFIGRNRFELVLAALLESILDPNKYLHEESFRLPEDGCLDVCVEAEELKWVVFRIGPIIIRHNHPVNPTVAGLESWKMQWLELDLLNACVSAFGGELMFRQVARNIICIEFRLPVHFEDERSQLIALIDMLHCDDSHVV